MESLMFKLFRLGKKKTDEKLRKTLMEIYNIGFQTGVRLTACGIESVLFRVKKIDTWDSDLKAEIIDICESILEAKKM